MARIIIDPNNLTGYRTLDGFVEIPVDPSMGDQQKMLTIVNHLLAHHRQFAWDHEAKAHQGQGEMFYGAALLRTAENKYYLTANTHLKDSSATRDCAEANGATEAVQDVLANKMEIEEIWFMGGKGDRSKGTLTLPGEFGRRNTPCGSCLDVINSHKLKNGHETLAHMLPLNEGDWKLIPDHGNHKGALAKHQVMTRAIGELLPYTSIFISDLSNRLKPVIMRGMDYLQSNKPADTLSYAMKPGDITTAIDAEAPMESMHRILMDTVRQEYGKREDGSLRKCTATVVRTTNGSYHLGVYIDDGKTLATPDSVYNAIQNALGEPITDSFVLSVDFPREASLRESYQRDAKHSVKVTPPSGDMRNRITKARAKDNTHHTDYHGKGMGPNQKPTLHMLLPVAPDEFKPAHHVQTVNSDKMIPYGYTNPKNDGCSHHGGCQHHAHR